MKTLQGKTILIVDDERELRDVMGEILEMNGASVRLAGNGEQALKELAMVDKVDLIVSDVRMPGTDGIYLLEKVREKGKSAPIVILISGYADLSPEEAKAKGALDLIAKPFHIREFLDTLAKALGS